MSKSMDRARRQSLDRDLAKRPERPVKGPHETQHDGYPSAARRKGMRVPCPECPPNDPPSSSNFTLWDASRQLWICATYALAGGGCGFTETMDERRDRLERERSSDD